MTSNKDFMSIVSVRFEKDYKEIVSSIHEEDLPAYREAIADYAELVTLKLMEPENPQHDKDIAIVLSTMNNIRATVSFKPVELTQNLVLSVVKDLIFLAV